MTLFTCSINAEKVFEDFLHVLNLTGCRIPAKVLGK